MAIAREKNYLNSDPKSVQTAITFFTLKIIELLILESFVQYIFEAENVFWEELCQNSSLSCKDTNCTMGKFFIFILDFN